MGCARTRCDLTSSYRRFARKHPPPLAGGREILDQRVSREASAASRQPEDPSLGDDLLVDAQVVVDHAIGPEA